MADNRKYMDLSDIKTSKELLSLLGKELHLGGSNGNHPVEAVNAGEGWGMNWDALADSLCCLDSGGIWGTSPKIKFPLTLEFMNFQQFKALDRKGFQTLESILRSTKETYQKSNLKFDYVFTSDSAA